MSNQKQHFGSYRRNYRDEACMQFTAKDEQVLADRANKLVNSEPVTAEVRTEPKHEGN